MAFGVKWAASIAQIGGYGATAAGWVPLNLLLFSAGLAGWFVVGLLWRDRAIMLLHVCAAIAMGVGYVSG
ncbi:MAG: DUF6552 family protein [Pseudomonadota bacterium]